MVRGSILAALDAIDSADAPKAARRAGAIAPAGADRGGWLTMRRARIWVPAALAAVAGLRVRNTAWRQRHHSGASDSSLRRRYR